MTSSPRDFDLICPVNNDEVDPAERKGISNEECLEAKRRDIGGTLLFASGMRDD